MRKSATFFAEMAFLALATAGCSGGAVNQTFSTTLSRANEVPPTPPAVFSNADGSATAQGSAQIVVDGPAAKYTVSTSGLTGITGSHIHLAAANVNGSIVVFLFDGPTTSATTASSGVLAKSDFSAATVAACTPGCAASTFDNIVAAMQAKPSGAYVNVHTTSNPGGAIRGQLQ